MVVCLTGPSGSGKTSVITYGLRNGLWGVVLTYTTRPSRQNGRDSAKVDSCLWHAWASASEGYVVTSYDRHLYWNRLSEMRLCAAHLSDVYVCDFVHPYPCNLAQFGTHVVGVVLVPPDLKELERRLAISRRLGRLASAASDFRRIHDAGGGLHPWNVVINSDVGRTATEIRRLALTMMLDTEVTRGVVDLSIETEL